MADYTKLKAAIRQVIKQNGNNEITGDLLQQTLLSMVNTLGEGRMYMGVARPDTLPIIQDGNVFYIASLPGVYSGFGGKEVRKGTIGIFTNIGVSWNLASINLSNLGMQMAEDAALQTEDKTIVGAVNEVNKIAKDAQPKEPNKGLSTNDFTNNYKEKVDNALLKINQVLTAEEQKQVLSNIGGQSKTDNTLNTENKTVVGAINEVVNETGLDSYQEFINSNHYNIGDVVKYNSNLYRFIYSYDGGDWRDDLVVATHLDEHKDIITELYEDINGKNKIRYNVKQNKTLSPYNSRIRLNIAGGKYYYKFSSANNNITGLWSIYFLDDKYEILKQIDIYEKFSAIEIPDGVKYFAVYIQDSQIIGEDIIEIIFKSETLYPGLKDEVITALNNIQELKYGFYFPLSKFIKEGGYISKVGELIISGNYSYTEFIPILPNITFTVKNFQSGNEYMAGLAYYTKNKAFISMVQSVTSKQVSDYTFEAKTIPNNAYYVRISLPVQTDNIQSSWDFSVSKERIIEELGGKESAKPNKNIFSSYQKELSINQNEVLSLPPMHIGKNAVLTGEFSELNSISIGVGYSDIGPDFRDYSSLWVDIDSTNVSQYRYYNNGHQLIDAKSHNMTFGKNIIVEIDFKINQAILRIFDGNGNIYTQELEAGGVGQPFIINKGTHSIKTKISFFPQELNKPIWLIGDSYISYQSNSRWPYYLKDYGFINFLSNNQPGLSPYVGVADLESLLSSGARPKYLMWLLGMNGATGETDGTINAYQKQYLDKVKELCNMYDITPILCTIPPVPERNKAGFNKYVKSLNVRYIDFAKAVGASDTGVWKEGMLSSDKVHPDELGAKALAAQVLIDFPEITMI